MGELPEPERGHNSRPLLDNEQLSEPAEVALGVPVLPELRHVLTQLLDIDPRQRGEEISRSVRLSDGPHEISVDRKPIDFGPNKGRVKTTLRLVEASTMRVSLALLDEEVVDLILKTPSEEGTVTLEGSQPEQQQKAVQEIAKASDEMGLAIASYSSQ